MSGKYLSDYGWDSKADFIMGFSRYFRNLGYQIPQSFEEDFFRASSGPEEFLFPTLEELEYMISALAVKTKEEHASFHDDFIAYARNQREVTASRTEAERIRAAMSKKENQKKELEALAKEEKKKLEKVMALEKAASDGKYEALVSRNMLASAEKSRQKIQKEYTALFRKSPLKEEILSIPAMAAGERELPDLATVKKMKDELKNAAIGAVTCRNFREVMEYISQQSGFLERIRKARESMPEDPVGQAKAELEQNRKQQNRLLKEAAEAEKRLQKLLQEIRNPDAQIKKTAPVIHRDDFMGYGNAVQLISEADPVMEKKFQALTAEEKELIRGHIEENARKFRTRMSRNIRTGSRRKLDLPQTCKKACSTNGIPLQLEYVKPGRSKAKLCMFLDVSGSCKEASEMMLTFMHEMREVFPGGCETFVFVDSLYDVSEIFQESRDSRESVEGILNAVPRRGVYSNYYIPLKDFAENHIHRITKDTIVFFIGDARNNKNDPGLEYMKAVCRKAKKAYWLETEERSKWDYNDSIIGKYAQYMDGIAETLNCAQLVSFLMEVK